AEGKGAIHAVRIDNVSHVVVTDAKGKDTEVLAGGKWESASLARDGKHVALLGRLWNGDDIVVQADVDEGKLVLGESHRTEDLTIPVAFAPDGKRLAYPGLSNGLSC